MSTEKSKRRFDHTVFQHFVDGLTLKRLGGGGEGGQFYPLPPVDLPGVYLLEREGEALVFGDF